MNAPKVPFFPIHAYGLNLWSEGVLALVEVGAGPWCSYILGLLTFENERQTPALNKSILHNFCLFCTTKHHATSLYAFDSSMVGNSLLIGCSCLFINWLFLLVSSSGMMA
ncbi:hypothetical protein Leryth_026187 [Lithospermum erythrorhizon]|nr:hypothetical protein Leryth_026187 [Lithospermum erythrorhizon]